MNKPVAGFVIAGVLVAVALVAYGCNHISITKKPNSNASSVVAQTTTTVGSGQELNTNTETQTTTTTSAKYDRKNPTTMAETTLVAPETVAPETSATVPDKGLLEFNGDVDVSGAEQQTTGVVSEKKTYIDGSQIVYLVTIEATVGTENKLMDYFCTYSTFSSLNEGEMLNVTYKTGGSGTFFIMGISK